MFSFHRPVLLGLIGLVAGYDSASGQELFKPTELNSTAPPDAGLFAFYNFPLDFQHIYMSICGKTRDVEGCDGLFVLGPFGRAAAIVEGYATVIGDVTQRNIYICDTVSGTDGTQVTLYRYRRADTISPSQFWTTVTLTKSIPLPIVGGENAVCSMAANLDYVFVGTDQSAQAVMIKKGSLDIMTKIGGDSSNSGVSMISADDYGYVTITNGAVGATGSNLIIAPDGGFASDGGGAEFMVTSKTGLSLTKLPIVPGGVADVPAIKDIHMRQH